MLTGIIITNLLGFLLEKIANLRQTNDFRKN